MRRRTLENSLKLPKGATLDKSVALAGNICISNGKLIGFISLTNWQAYTGTEYKAIGIVACTVGSCGDNYIRVCSIPYMSYSTPNVGSTTEVKLSWNGYAIDIGSGVTTTSSISVAGAGYKGKNNTNAIIAKATGLSNWRTASTITNSTSESTNRYFPASCCCWRFYTLGTSQGLWYLPSAGEFLKALDNKTNIVASLNAFGINVYTSEYWVSTTVNSHKNSFAITWSSSNLTSKARYQTKPVRAFILF